MSSTRDLGYDGLILFLDELILWLASQAADLKFVHQEGQKLAKLVEAQSPDRPVPIVSFVARQRDLSELIGDSVLMIVAYCLVLVLLVEGIVRSRDRWQVEAALTYRQLLTEAKPFEGDTQVGSPFYARRIQTQLHRTQRLRRQLRLRRPACAHRGRLRPEPHGRQRAGRQARSAPRSGALRLHR